MDTSVNYGGGQYQIVSEGHIIINDYHEMTEIGKSEHQEKFDDQLLFAFNGIMYYSYTKDKLVFRGEQDKKIVFERIKR